MASLKDLFVINPDKAKDKPKEEPVKEASKTKFPTASTPKESTDTSFFGFGKTPSFNPEPTVGQISQEDMDKAVEIYQQGFDALNQAGYDFYEFYMAIMSIGVENAPAYQMAFSMGKTLDKSITKEKLVHQADFYAAEIMKSYEAFVSKGSAKKEELSSYKTQENKALMSDLDSLKQQMEAIKVQISDRENKLKAIDGKYEPQIRAIDSKLGANDVVKDKIILTINQVKQGINNNI